MKNILSEEVFNKSCLFVIVTLFLYVFFLLVLNVDRGFDITDESFYLLWAMHPEQVSMSSTNFGFYTQFLFYLAGKSVAIFRLYGIVLLLAATCGFSWLLYQYIIGAVNITFNLYSQLIVLFSLLTSSLIYYQLWLVTPSYNWLALVSVIIVMSGLLLLVSESIGLRHRPTVALLLISIGGFLAFMAKPTTALGLMLISFVWLMFHYRSINFRHVFIMLPVLLIILFGAHILLFENGLFAYIEKIKSGIELGSMLGGGHEFKDLADKAYDQLIYRVTNLYSINVSIILPVLIFVIISTRIIIERKYFVGIDALTFFSYGLGLLSLFYIFFLLYPVIGAKYYSTANRLIWFYGLKILVFLITSSAVMYFVINKEKITSFSAEYKNLLLLVFTLLFCSFSYSFGTANELIKAMTGSFLFMLAAILSVSLFFDNYLNKQLFTSALGVLISIFMVNNIYNAYMHPYRLEASLSEQVTPVQLLSGSVLRVDEISAEYINAMKNTALSEGWEQGMALIDMTGGTPGANVILDAGFLGTPWLLGSYKGSNDFALMALTNNDKSRVKKAWLLIAPHGGGSISLDVLSKVGIDFPKNYKLVSTLKTKHRNEVQQIWAPL